MQHRIDDTGRSTEEHTLSMQDVTIEIFGQKRTYAVEITGIDTPISESRWSWIKGIIEIYIKSIEDERHQEHQRTCHAIEEMEESMDITIGRDNNYGELLLAILRNNDIP